MKYELDNQIVTMTFDDGKANVVGHRFLDEINAGLDRALDEGEMAGFRAIGGVTRSWFIEG